MSDFNFKDKAGAVASKAKSLASAAAAKTKKLSRIAKLNMDISGRRETVKKAYYELGKLYYEAHQDNPEGLLVQVCQEIDLAKEDIASMEGEIAQLKESMKSHAADLASVVEATEAEADLEVEVIVEDDIPEGEETSVEIEIMAQEDPAEEFPVERIEVTIVEETPEEEAPAEEEVPRVKRPPTSMKRSQWKRLPPTWEMSDAKRQLPSKKRLPPTEKECPERNHPAGHRWRLP